jgi:hypothetical protein
MSGVGIPGKPVAGAQDTEAHNIFGTLGIGSIGRSIMFG